MKGGELDMNEQLVREIIESGSATLTKLAEAAGSTGEHVYGVLVRQKLTEGISGLFEISIFIPLLLIPIYKAVKWGMKKEKEDNYSENISQYIIPILFSLVWFLLSLLIVDTISTSILKLVNPEYFAIEFIFESIKSGH